MALRPQARLVGENSGGTISNSYATGNVTATGTGSGDVYAGGLVGENNGTISNSYATAEVTGTGSQQCVRRRARGKW